jgi:hypothetical protein
VTSYDLDSLRLLARQHHEKRLHEATVERRARELGGNAQRGPRLRLAIGFSLKARQAADQPRLEASRRHAA